ncbi:MAG: FtsX-like permease family protein [Planctomycetota bacterium]|nr:FtsX-like permease family protein [Planctomycetota bacterium]MDA1211659.1 FtsX-like permease family protein [Planctomycetota bacterium]
MNALDRKLIRDMRHMTGQTIAIAAVIACGVATYVMALTVLGSLSLTRETYYDRYGFAHIFAQVKRAPKTLESRLAEIPGVAQVETRTVFDVTLNVEGLEEPAIGRLISLPERKMLGINALYLRRGKMLQPGRYGEVLVSESFADAHQLEEGDKVRAVINGRLKYLTISGVALTPEYIFQIRPGELIPDEKRFGIFWMWETELEAAFNMQGAFNDITLTMTRDASEANIIADVDRLTEQYGGIGAYGRDDQVSHRYLSDEMKQLRSMAFIPPLIFLSVAAFLLNVVLARLINTQREQIAALKAFGYSKLQIGVHYGKYVAVIVICGVTAGSIAGIWLAHGLTELYVRFYKFPVFLFKFDSRVIIWALFWSSLSGFLGVLFAVYRAVNLPPAEAMRPEPPANFKPTIVERIGLGTIFTNSARMILRHLERQPIKSSLSALGISLAVAVLVMGRFMEDCIDHLMEYEFQMVQRQDVMLSFREGLQSSVWHEINHLPGVMYGQKMRVAPTRIHFGHRYRRVAILGMEPGGDLFRVLDENDQPWSISGDGIVMSETLAKVLHAKRGDVVTVEVLAGKRPIAEIPVTGLVPTYSGLNAYMSNEALHRLLDEQGSLTGGYLKVDSKYYDELYQTLRNTPAVAGVSIKDAAIQSFQETIAENLSTMRTFNLIFATIIAFGVVYNTARISLSERSRELATLRVIGFTEAEISMLLFTELGILTVVALPMGMVIGYGFCALSVANFDSESFRIPLVIKPMTYGYSAIVVIVAAILSGMVVRRRINELDLIAVLKARD